VVALIVGEVQMRIIPCIIMTVALSGVQGAGQVADSTDRAKDKNMFATNECFAKGGIGIVDKELYVVLKSARNELLLGGGNPWTGATVPTAEMVIVFDGKVLAPEKLPRMFDLSRSVVVSFENDKVRFFDFRKLTGGYYKRPRQDRQP
jgi:hypothetical protein